MSRSVDKNPREVRDDPAYDGPTRPTGLTTEPIEPAVADARWPEGGVTHDCPVYQDRRFTHSVRFHDRP